MFSKTVLLFGASVAILLGGVNLGCSNSSTANAGNEPAAQPVTSAAPASTDDPFHIAKPTAPIDGVPAPQATPSPEAIVANKKVCPSCGTPNAANAPACVKCGHKFE
jgi:ribosomal protein L40E